MLKQIVYFGAILSNYSLGTQIWVATNSLFQHWSSFMKFYVFTEQRVSQINVHLKYIDGYTREADTLR